MHHCRQPCFGVAGTASVHAAVANDRIKRGNRHPRNGCSICVGFQYDAPAWFPAWQARNQVGPAWKHLLAPSVDSPPGEETLDIGSDFRLRIPILIGRVDAV